MINLMWIITTIDTYKNKERWSLKIINFFVHIDIKSHKKRKSFWKEYTTLNWYENYEIFVIVVVVSIIPTTIRRKKINGERRKIR